MNRVFINLILVFTFLLSCQKSDLQQFDFDGDLIAKKIVELTGNFPDDVQEIDYKWFISTLPDGAWEILPGIHTARIVLLTDYVDHYLKCEASFTVFGTEKIQVVSVISKDPVVYEGNPNTDWFKDAGYGIMVHYLKPVIVPEGGSREWNDAVNSFDVERFASQANQANAGFVMFTLGQNSGYYCSPNAAFDSIVGTKPGELCSVRDLPMELMKALQKYNIPLILYLPANPPVSNKLVSEKFHYPYGRDSATSQYNQAILEDMIREWSMRYGEGVKGWWFDGLYKWNNILSTRMDMSLDHNISTHTLAAKAGNKNSIVTYNYGFGKIQVNTPYCDYSSGEKRTIDEYPESRWVKKGVQWFLFTYLGERWGDKGSQFETDSLVYKAQKIVSSDGVLCLEVVATPDGEILPHHLEQVIAVGQMVEEQRQ